MRPAKKEEKKESRSLQELLESSLKKLGFDKERFAVFEVWDRLLGPEAAKARAVGLKGTRLCVEVDSNARLHDITLRKRTLLKKVNGHFGTNNVISDIIFTLAGHNKL
ncbi:MAG TPA: DUF721 domain-containing protein [Elusimicrobiota bacterium]|nr:DUF721 domain-containing protein [Elusimicrobiota bacterium]